MLEHHHSRPKGSSGHRYRFTVEELRDIARELRMSEQNIAMKWGTTRALVDSGIHGGMAEEKGERDHRSTSSHLSG